MLLESVYMYLCMFQVSVTRLMIMYGGHGRREDEFKTYTGTWTR